MARRRRKSIASTSEETPKNDTATATAVEGVTDAQEDSVASRSVLDNDTVVYTAVEGITDMQDLEHSAVIAPTNSVNGSIEYDNDTTVEISDLKDGIIVAIDEKNGVELNSAEANEEIVAEEEDDYENEQDNKEDEDEDEEDEDEDEEDEGEEEEEDDLYLESNVDGDLAVNNDDGDEDIDDDTDDEEGDEEEDEDDEEENDDNYGAGDDNKLETENEEKHNEEDVKVDVKVVNDAGSQENTPAEEVTKSNTQKGVNIKGEGLKKKVRPVGNMNDKKNPGGVSGQENLKAEHDGRQDDSGVVIEEPDGGRSKENIEGRGGGNSKQKGKNLRKESRMTTVNGRGSKIVSSEREDKPKQLPKKNSSKKVKSMGMIFICSTKTRNDCFQYKVLGQPASKRETVEKIYKGMRLFLYDIDRKLLYGIYKAAGPGGYNIQPKAFNSQFPAQVRFTVMEDCLPIAEEKFKRVIKDNYYTKKKFDTLLTSQQVKDLCKLFAATKHSKHGASEMQGRGLRRKAPVSKRQRQDRSRDRDEGLRSVKHRYKEYSPYRERVVPPLHQSSRLPLPRSAALPYAYDRALDVDGYRRDPLVEHRDRRDGLIERRDPYIQDALVERRDPYRQDALVDRRDPYRQDALVEHRDLYRQDALVEHLGSYRRPVLDRDAYRSVSLLDHHDVYRPHALLDDDSSYRRRDEVVQRHDLSSLDDEYRRVNPLISYRQAGSSGDDITMLDRYRSYRDRADYRDPVSSSRLVPEEAGYTIVGRSTAALLPEYRSVRTRYRY